MTFDISNYGWFGVYAGPAGGLIMGGLVPAQGMLTAYPKYYKKLNNTKPPENNIYNEVY